MNPDLEFFLEDAFHGLAPTSDRMGRVVVEPDYEITQWDADKEQLRNELVELVENRKADLAPSSNAGIDLPIPERLNILRRYIRTVMVHPDRAPGDWVEVTPPGNWI